mmetsp:Transcript_77267/g.194330  ORF Transcript_77267/g.194330 Transcript_77267/m.194330 type:complete len:613 (+) Transcript_77267:63-1901(+)
MAATSRPLMLLVAAVAGWQAASAAVSGANFGPACGPGQCAAAHATSDSDESAWLQLQVHVNVSGPQEQKNSTETSRWSNIYKEKMDTTGVSGRARGLKELGDHLIFDMAIPLINNVLPAAIVPDVSDSSGSSSGGPVNVATYFLSGVLVIFWFVALGANRKLSAEHGSAERGASPEGAAHASPKVLRWYHVLLLVQLDVLAPVTQDAYIPSMPVMAVELHTTESAVGLSLQINWILSGLVALALGIASDKYGRRPVLLFALTCYVIGSLIAAMAPNVEWLIFGRCIQGVGGGSQALCYAISRDLIEDEEERSQFNNILSILGCLAIVLAPVAGGMVAVFLGWRMVFVLLACWGLVALFNIFALLPETKQSVQQPALNAPSADDQGTFAPLFNVFKRSLRPLGLMICMWMLMGTLFGQLSSLSFVFDVSYGLSTTGIFVCMSLLAMSALGGCAFCCLMLVFNTSWQVLRFGMTWLLAFGTSFLVMGIIHSKPPMFAFLGFAAAYIFGLNVLMGPLRSVLAEPFGDAAGIANGFAMMFADPSGAVLGIIFTWALEQSGLSSWMVALGFTAMLHQAIFWGLVGLRAEEDPIFALPSKASGASSAEEGAKAKGVAK